MLLASFYCNTVSVIALAVGPMGVRFNICNAVCLWESLSARARKHNNTKMTNKIHNFNECFTASDLIMLLRTVTSHC